MAIRCITATAYFLEISYLKSMAYKVKLIFLLRILFWVGRNEQ